MHHLSEPYLLIFVQEIQRRVAKLSFALQVNCAEQLVVGVIHPLANISGYRSVGLDVPGTLVKVIRGITVEGHCRRNVAKTQWTYIAVEHFEKQLAYFRQFYPVKTICMHGAPRSKYDGRDLWKRYDYHDFGIIGEPYFDVDFSRVFYLTDTGRRWDGFNVSLRDKVPVYQDEWVRQGLVFHRTDEVIDAIENEKLPKQLMMTTHPQRWTDHVVEWHKEKAMQSTKNMVKGLMVRLN